MLLAASSVKAEEEGLTYTPNNDVTGHSKIALDQLDIKELVDAGDLTGALDIYQNGKNAMKASGEMRTLQAMAQVDWVEQGVEDLSAYDAYAMLFKSPGPKTDYLDSFTMDAMTGTGTFSDQTSDMQAISAKKNLLCTGLNYAQYEGVKAIQFANEKNWDELFAFWNGVYDSSVDERVNTGTPGAVQKSRDGDFGTSFREASLQAIIDGQKAFEGGLNKEKLEKAFEAFNKANLATFAQATLKYADIYSEAGLEQAKIDKKWGEGYAYFRCGAGLMNPELAVYIDYELDPRDKDMSAEIVPHETSCKIIKKMLSLPDIGMGVTVDDLNVEAYLPNIKTDCELENFKHTAGAKKSDSVRAFIPILGLLLVCSVYIVGFCKFGRGRTRKQ